MEQTLIIIKPDGICRRLIGKIITRIEEKGFKIAGMKMLWMDKELASQHYQEHKGKTFYESLIDFITQIPVIVMVVEGVNVIKEMRKLVGKTNPSEALPGTIRGDFATITQCNLIHASDSIQSAQREIKLFFKESEIFSYQLLDEKFLF